MHEFKLCITYKKTLKLIISKNKIRNFVNFIKYYLFNKLFDTV